MTFPFIPGVPNAFGLVGAENNAVAAGKRPLSSMSPTLVLQDGEPVLMVGAAGGPKIITQVVLTIVRYLDLDFSLQDAVAAPRLHHQWRPDRLMLERDFPEEIAAALREMGHQTRNISSGGVCQAVGTRRRWQAPRRERSPRGGACRGKVNDSSGPIDESSHPMKVLLARPRGFCAGVNMAIESLELALQAFGAPVYVYHEIVHNKFVVDSFRQRGAVFVDSLDHVPSGSYLLFSAHGVSPEVRRIAKSRQLIAIDATCPLVTKVHLEAIRFAQAGFTIVLIGHDGHDEVIGTMGEAPDAIVLVETPEDVDRLQIADPRKVAYLTQTTLSVDDANRIIARLRERYPHIQCPPKEDICYATQNRQEAVRRLMGEADVGAVVGSQNSSNSQRLCELAGNTRSPPT